MIYKQSKIFKGDILCDKKGLIFEAYNMKDIDSGSCRVIFFDWLMSLDPSFDQSEAIDILLKAYSVNFPNHPMTKLLIEGIDRNLGMRKRRRAKTTRKAI